MTTVQAPWVQLWMRDNPVRNLMNKRGLTPAVLAKKSGVPSPTLYDCLRASHRTRVINLFKFAKPLRVEFDHLVQAYEIWWRLKPYGKTENRRGALPVRGSSSVAGAESAAGTPACVGANARRIGEEGWRYTADYRLSRDRASTPRVTYLSRAGKGFEGPAGDSLVGVKSLVRGSPLTGYCGCVSEEGIKVTYPKMKVVWRCNNCGVMRETFPLNPNAIASAAARGVPLAWQSAWGGMMHLCMHGTPAGDSVKEYKYHSCALTVLQGSEVEEWELLNASAKNDEPGWGQAT